MSFQLSYLASRQLTKSLGSDAGVMVWEFPDAAAAWISAVRSIAFPV